MGTHGPLLSDRLVERSNALPEIVLTEGLRAITAVDQARKG
ncbi:hypothetical protein BH10ACT10_BH10ACT10_24760 [soil metagenome]